MAKRITGCGWAYEVIEGMDEWLRNNMPYESKGHSRPPTAFAARSRKAAAISAKSSGEPQFDHLAVTGYDQYRKIKRQKHDEFLAYAEGSRTAPRPKIIVMDVAWNRRSHLMPAKAVFLTAECQRINGYRSRLWPGDKERGKHDYRNPFLRHRKAKAYNPNSDQFEEFGGLREIDHGSACVAALRISDRDFRHQRMIRGYRGPQDDQATKEANLWNLSSRADLVLLPIRFHARLSKAVYYRALEVARSTRFLTPELHDAFANDNIFDLVNRCSTTDRSKTIEWLTDAVLNELRKEILVAADNSQKYEDGTKEVECYDLQRLFFRALQAGIAEDPGLRPEVILNEFCSLLLGALCLALEEAGLSETLGLVRKASGRGYRKVGRGDTLVAPIEINLWNSKSRQQLEDTLHFDGSDINAHSFLNCGEYSEDPNDEGASLLSISEYDKRPPADAFGRIDLPIVAFRRVEEEIQTLTCNHKISVIISGGNSHIDLGQICIEKLDRYLPTPRFAEIPDHEEARKDSINRGRRRLFESRGVNCGAVIAGSGIPQLSEFWMDPLQARFAFKKGEKCAAVARHADGLKNSVRSNVDAQDYHQLFPNYGLVVDVFGRGAATEIHDYKHRVVPREVYYHWCGASITSIVAAACLANIQQIRMLSDFVNRVQYARKYNDVWAQYQDNEDELGQLKFPLEPDLLRPLKPFEARAHFRQWRSNDSYRYDCLEDLTGPPPDIRAWFEGSCYFDKLQDFARDGQKLIDEIAAQEHAEPAE